MKWVVWFRKLMIGDGYVSPVGFQTWRYLWSKPYMVSDVVVTDATDSV